MQKMLSFQEYTAESDHFPHHNTQKVKTFSILYAESAGEENFGLLTFCELFCKIWFEFSVQKTVQKLYIYYVGTRKVKLAVYYTIESDQEYTVTTFHNILPRKWKLSVYYVYAESGGRKFWTSNFPWIILQNLIWIFCVYYVGTRKRKLSVYYTIENYHFPQYNTQKVIFSLVICCGKLYMYTVENVNGWGFDYNY